MFLSCLFAVLTLSTLLCVVCCTRTYYTYVQLSCGQVCEWLWRCLSTDRGMRPSMEAVANMLQDLLTIDD